jgi:adenosylcobinamide-phosphate synthase
MGFEGLAPSAPLLLFGLLLDALLGDPQIRLHPIRLIGDSLNIFERALRRTGMTGYLGGVALFVLLAALWVALPSFLIYRLNIWNSKAAAILHVLIVYVFFAMRDLVDHIRRVRAAARREDLAAARTAIAMLVGRDVSAMDLDGCRRAAIESLSENFVDGFLSALVWYAIAGLPGLLLFKIASTMDSMVGYKTEKYRRFGWFGARLDDVLNYVPARVAWLLLGLCTLPFSGLSASKGWRIGLQQHRTVPGPNPGWSEATMAGLLQRRLIGPIYKEGALVTDVWLGDSDDPAAGSDSDVTRALKVTLTATGVATILAAVALWV